MERMRPSSVPHAPVADKRIQREWRITICRVTLGEILDFEGLADDCAADGVWSFSSARCRSR
jgi:hypothetical protein